MTFETAMNKFFWPSIIGALVGGLLTAITSGILYAIGLAAFGTFGVMAGWLIAALIFTPPPSEDLGLKLFGSPETTNEEES